MVLCEVSWDGKGFRVEGVHGWEEKTLTYRRWSGLSGRLVKKSEMLKLSGYGLVWCLPEDVEKAKLVFLEWHKQGADALEQEAAKARQVVAKMREVLGGDNDTV